MYSKGIWSLSSVFSVPFLVGTFPFNFVFSSLSCLELGDMGSLGARPVWPSSVAGTIEFAQ